MKELVGPKNAEMRDIRFFGQIPQIAAEIVEEKVDWVIIAGGDGTYRAMIEQLANRQVCALHQRFSCRYGKSGG